MEGPLSEMGASGEGLKIGELAEEAGVPVATVRHYLREGLLPEGRKTSRNMAYYEPEAVELIGVIKRLQEERYMPLRVIGGLLKREDCDLESLKASLEPDENVLDHALGDERIRTPRVEVEERLQIPADVLDRLEQIGVVGPDEVGYSPSDIAIIEAIQRFRAGGFDEQIGFTVHDAAGFIEPLAELARREVELLDKKLIEGFDAERATELLDAGIEPLRELIAAMHSKALAREVERHRGADGSARDREDGRAAGAAQ